VSFPIQGFRRNYLIGPLLPISVRHFEKQAIVFHPKFTFHVTKDLSCKSLFFINDNNLLDASLCPPEGCNPFAKHHH
jgi:hypothetical protein